VAYKTLKEASTPSWDPMQERRLQSAKLVDPVVTRHIALAMSRHGNLTLACRTVMQVAREIAKSGAVVLRRT